MSDAAQDAAEAADRAGVTVRELDTGEVNDAAALLESMWGSGVVEAPMMVALRHAGAYVAGAFAEASLIGVCVGYFSQPLGTALHSHVAAVAPDSGRRGIGIALKMHQRAWALARGLERITWTFDPLVARNAAFNLTRLQVDIAEYLVDFYGDMPDTVNAGQGSDRMLASWNLSRRVDAVGHPRVPGKPATEGEQASALLTTGVHGEPVPLVPVATTRLASVSVPPDIARLRAQDPALGTAWRLAVRDAVAPRLSHGWTVVGFDDNRYLLEAS